MSEKSPGPGCQSLETGIRILDGVKTVRLRTPRLHLEPFTSNMVSPNYVGWLNNPAVVRYSEQRHRQHTQESCLAYVCTINQETAHLWAILVADRHIGNISAHRDILNGTADVGMVIGDRDSQGRGYGSEAWRAVCDWLLVTNVRKVTAGTMAENLSMLRVFEKTGMVEEGRRRAQFLLSGEPVDLVMVARFRS